MNQLRKTKKVPLEIKDCCRLCTTSNQVPMTDCANNHLTKYIKDIFGVEILVNDPFSTKICMACLRKVVDFIVFKSQVQGNQTQLEECRILQELVNMADLSEEEDDVIFVAVTDLNGNKSEQPGETIEIRKSVVTESKEIDAAKYSLNFKPVKNPKHEDAEPVESITSQAPKIKK